jgi:nicotinamidase-related amidase
LDVRPGDAVIRKGACDAFQGTRLAAQLRRWGIGTVVLLGYATEFCVDSTVRRATSRGLRVVVVRDGHTTNDSPVLPATRIIAHHNRTWAEMDCFPKVFLVSARDLKFRRGASRRPAIRK